MTQSFQIRRRSLMADWSDLLGGQTATEFTEDWVKHRFRNLAEEMVGIREASSPWLRRRVTGTLTRETLDYAKKMIPITDANAARLIDAALDGRLTYVAGVWHFFDGIYHRPLIGVPVPFWVVMAFAEEFSSAMDWVMDEIDAFASRTAVPGQQTPQQIKTALMKEWREYASYDKELRQNAGINGLKSVLQQVCTKEDGYFDNDWKWLVCQNGVLDIEKFRQNPARLEAAFGPLDQRLPVARAVSCDFVPGAHAPVWEAFLESSVPDPEVRDFLQRCAGAALMGRNNGEDKVKAIPNLKGRPDSGKSVFVDTLATVFGGYAATPDGGSIQETRGDTNFERDDLRGKRFICISEPSADKRLDDGFVKGFTGGDMVKSRTLHQKSRSWRPQGVIFVASNHVLKLNTRDEAILNRLCLVEFPHQFKTRTEWQELGVPEGEWHIKDPDLETKLADPEEQEGILMWALRGAYMFLQHEKDVAPPASVKRAGQQYAIDASRTLSWITEKIEEGLLYETKNVSDQPLRSYAVIGKLYQAYAQDAAMDNEKPIGKRAFASDLRQRYGEPVKAGGVRVPTLAGRGILSWIDGKTEAHQL
jgi:P4 family phage/plasmid primase-like protien